MTKSTLHILVITIFSISLGTLGCTNTSKVTKTNTTVESRNELQEEPAQPVQKNLYLMLHLVQNDSTGAISILNIEKQIYEKQGNPRPLNDENMGTQLFTCEIKNKDGEIIRKSEKKINFTMGDSHNESILKFILPWPQYADYVEIKHLNAKGVWEKIYVEKP